MTCITIISTEIQRVYRAPDKRFEITRTKESELKGRYEYKNRLTDQKLDSDGKTINQEMVYENK